MRAKLLGLALAAAVPAAALASGDSVPNVMPRDLGLAASAVAAQRDAGAVYAMPAALPRLEEGLHLAVGASLLDIGATWNAPVGPADSSTKFRLAPPGAAYAAYATKIGDTPVGFGAGFTTPFGGNVFWNQSWPGRFKVTTVDRKIYGMYLNGAVQSGPYLRLAAGLIYYRGTEYLGQAIDFVGSQGSLEASAKGGAASFQASVEVQPSDTFRLGVDYKHKAVLSLKGDGAFHGVPVELRPSLPDQTVTHDLPLPNVAEAGAAWQARTDLLVTFTYTFERYIVYREDRFVGSAGTTVVVPRNYGNGHTFRGGVEYRLTPAIELRAGGERDVSGMQESLFDPSLPDASSWAASGGASWRFLPNMSVDAAFFYAWFDRVHAQSAPFPGVYDINAWIASIGLTWRQRAR
jgi:long-chain fatty acid transport protein